MTHSRKSFIQRISFLIFSFLLLLTAFLPTISLDRYVEYDFTHGYYNEKYQSFVEPIASNISPMSFIKSLFLDGETYTKNVNKYSALKKELKGKLDTGQISQKEYDDKLSSSMLTGEYYVYSLKYGNIQKLTRLQDKVFMFSVAITALYGVALITFIVNLINLFERKKLLCVANVFCGWILTILCFVVQFFTFGFAIDVKTQIDGIDGYILEEATVATSPKILSIVILFSLIVYATITLILDKIDTKYERQLREIPKHMNDQIKFNSKNQNRYRKINSKKSKYKHGSKKKRHR